MRDDVREYINRDPGTAARVRAFFESAGDDDPPAVVIVDVDGTLCDVTGIRHYVTDPKRRDFDRFHRASALCPAIPETLEWVNAWRRDGAEVVIVTARQRQYEQITRTWLRKWGVTYDALYMRDSGDMRPDRDVKRDILASIRERWDVVAAIDDNPSIIALWESEGIQTTIAPGWPNDAKETA